MSELIPENMREIRLALLDEQDKGQSVTEEALIRKAVQDIFQVYLDNAEEGHYDTCKLVNPSQFKVIDILGKEVANYDSGDTSFVEQFKDNSTNLMLKLEDWAADVASE